MCDCLDKINENLKKNFGENNYYLELSNWSGGENLEYKESWFKPLDIRYKTLTIDPKGKKKDKEKWNKTFIKFTHCPFCGEKHK